MRVGLRTLEFDGFRIAAVDNSRKTVSDDTLHTLQVLCDEGVPLLILCHIPVVTPYSKAALTGLDPYFYIDETADENGRAFLSLCEKNETVKAVLCGHVHGYRETEIVPGKPQIIGSQGMTGAVQLITVCG